MWQIWGGRCIFQNTQGHQVWQNPLYRWLTFSSAPLQSILHRYKHQQAATDCVKTIIHIAKHISGSTLMLGLGGACIPHALAPYRNQAPWTLVEIDAEIISIAKNYFWLDELQPFDIIHSPAQDYLQQTNDNFGHILIDMADAQSFPQPCLNVLFFEQLRTRLMDSGVLSINLPDPRQHKIVLGLLKPLFRSSLIMTVKRMSNIILVLSNDSSVDVLANRIQLNKQCSNLHWQEQWGLVARLK